MIVHCSLWKFRDGTSAQQIEETASAWRGLYGRVPSIRQIRVGRDLGNWPENYDLAALVYFDGPEGYASYRDDPFHREFAERYLVPHIDGLHMRAAVQFELPAA